MNDEPVVRCLARSEIFDEDDGIVEHSLYLYKKFFNGDVSYVVIHNGTRYEFGYLISAIKKFNELNYNSLI